MNECPHLDAEDVGPSFDELIGEFQVVIQGVFLPHWVGDVAGVRDGGLDDATRRSGGFHPQQHVGHVVQGVKHPENVHAVLFGHLAEPAERDVTLGKRHPEFRF